MKWRKMLVGMEGVKVEEGGKMFLKENVVKTRRGTSISRFPRGPCGNGVRKEKAWEEVVIEEREKEWRGREL